MKTIFAFLTIIGVLVNSGISVGNNLHAAMPGVQTDGTIVMEDDIYLIVNTNSSTVTVKNVRFYTSRAASSFVTGVEGCANTYCGYNLQTIGLSPGTYLVEVETYSNTYFSAWINY